MILSHVIERAGMKTLQVTMLNGELIEYIAIDRYYVENEVLYVEYTRHTPKREGIPLVNIKYFKEV